jgi:predicted  nucleic acid-binding Zn-ribbon protein
VHEAIEKLLVLQDRDRALINWRAEIAGLEHERAEVNNRSAKAETAQAEVEQKAMELEARKDALELGAQAEQEKIRTYSKQQLETKDNTAYRALAEQIDDCREDISNLETDEIMVLEEIDVQAETLKQARTALAEARQDQATAQTEIDEREKNLNQNIEETEGLRAESAGVIEKLTLSRYERLLERRGANIVVGIQHGACGGCHMKLPTSEVTAVKSDREITHCPNCSRILYYTRDMVLESD